MQQDLERLSVGGHDDELGDAAVQCLGCCDVCASARGGAGAGGIGHENGPRRVWRGAGEVGNLEEVVETRVVEASATVLIEEERRLCGHVMKSATWTSYLMSPDNTFSFRKRGSDRGVKSTGR